MAAGQSRANARLAALSCSRFWVVKPPLVPSPQIVLPLLVPRPPPQADCAFFMLQQLAYVIITPYTLYKSRTGGILARLITRTGLELVGARMFAPSPDLVQEYSKVIVSANDPQDRRIQELLRDYILQNLAPEPKTGRRRRVMMLLFRGEDAVRKVRSVVGNINLDRRGGETIRDTYGDIVLDES